MEVHVADHLDIMGDASDGKKAEGVRPAEGPRAMLVSHVTVVGKGGVKWALESIHPEIVGVLLQLNVGHLLRDRTGLFHEFRGEADLVEELVERAHKEPRILLVDSNFTHDVV